MKKNVTLVFALACATALCAQTKEGTITYERKVDMHRSIKDEQMKAMMPQYQTANFILVFKDSISTYRPAPKDDAPDPFDNNNGGNRVIIRVGGPGDDGVTYKNYSSSSQLQENTLEDKTYIVADTIKPQPWKLSDETKTILNHVCKKATMTTERGEVTAWYAEDIPVPAGPDRFCGLPGTVLLVDMDNGRATFTAKEITAIANTKDLKAPAGKAITRAAFEKKMDEVMGPADAQGRRIINRN